MSSVAVVIGILRVSQQLLSAFSSFYTLWTPILQTIWTQIRLLQAPLEQSDWQWGFKVFASDVKSRQIFSEKKIIVRIRVKQLFDKDVYIVKRGSHIWHVFFIFLNKNICCGYTLEKSLRDASSKFKIYIHVSVFMRTQFKNCHFWVENHGEFIQSNTFEPRHDISNNVVCGPAKQSLRSALSACAYAQSDQSLWASDLHYQPVHTHSLIRAFASHLNILWLLGYWPYIIWSV